MDKKLYTIGLDYGSLSCRGVLAGLDGSIAAEAEMVYPHGILDHALPDGTPLRGNWYLQHPSDYLETLEAVVPALLARSGLSAEQVVGIGVDFTASTVMPLDAHFQPLCLDPAFADHPHAWCKLWKHHGAASQAERLTKICRERGVDLALYGGRISPECLAAKVLQVFEEDRAVYLAADAFIEAGDYMVSLLAGKPVVSASIAAAKALWRKTGYPDEAFFSAFHRDLADLPRQKLADHWNTVPLSPGVRAGGLCGPMARRLGLRPGIAVTPAQMDGYTPLPALGIHAPGQAVLVIGTSTAIMLLHETRCPVPGVTACLPDTYYPGLWGYASGQASVGDCLQWFVDQCLPESYAQEARREGMTPHAYLSRLAASLAPGETGLLALDWFNGNKSPLANSRLSGMMLGLTLQTRPEHIYRALLEATAFGARAIVDAYGQAGVGVRSLTACGGIAGKNPLMMQIYADVLGRPLRVSRCRQAPALGAAIYAAAAAREASGFPDVFAAVEAMYCREFIQYTPDPAAGAVYQRLYREYQTLSDYFGRGQNAVMERLNGQSRS